MARGYSARCYAIARSRSIGSGSRGRESSKSLERSCRFPLFPHKALFPPLRASYVLVDTTRWATSLLDNRRHGGRKDACRKAVIRTTEKHARLMSARKPLRFYPPSARCIAEAKDLNQVFSSPRAGPRARNAWQGTILCRRLIESLPSPTARQRQRQCLGGRAHRPSDGPIPS